MPPTVFLDWDITQSKVSGLCRICDAATPLGATFNVRPILGPNPPPERGSGIFAPLCPSCLEQLSSRSALSRSLNESAKRLLKDALALLATKATPDDDLPAAQACGFCQGSIHWPAVSAGYGGHKSTCPYEALRLRYESWLKRG